MLLACEALVLMSSGQRVYEMGYKLIFTGCAGKFEVEGVEGAFDISEDKKRAWEAIGENVRKMNPDDWELELYCLKCGEHIIVNDDDQAEFQCECTTETQEKR